MSVTVRPYCTVSVSVVWAESGSTTTRKKRVSARSPGCARCRRTGKRAPSARTASSIVKAAGMIDIATMPAPNPATPCTTPAARNAAKMQMCSVQIYLFERSRNSWARCRPHVRQQSALSVSGLQQWLLMAPVIGDILHQSIYNLRRLSRPFG